MSKEDFKTRDKMEIKRCVACLMRPFNTYESKGYQLFKN